MTRSGACSKAETLSVQMRAAHAVLAGYDGEYIVFDFGLVENLGLVDHIVAIYLDGDLCSIFQVRQA